MISNCKINKSTKWQYLPWKQIEYRVSILKNTIYQASKICNKKLIYKAQNSLINSNEAKVMAVEYVCKSIKNLYINFDKENYIISDMHKTHIFSFLFNEKRTAQHKMFQLFLFLVQKVEQYMIYLCLESEWNTRFRVVTYSSIYNCLPLASQNRNIMHYIQKNLHNTFHSSLFSYYIPSQYINLKYIKKKHIHFPIFHKKL
uniref:Reverse transcriptase N-terminal domain-containing protein n=1 Tax=Hydropuntia rangiferina TaxID=338881 RepID=A0A345U8B7_9FLOR|nr:hypothetical protein [Hydropuntia rangiferina]AXI96703.1 hypothetical protein [Hydropuntia rangiferina]UAD87386.1 hypothetical protein [Hydropuntia rangiferina]